MHQKEQKEPRSTDAEQTPSFFQKWQVATRPFALPASTMSVVFGTVLAVTIGGADFDAGLFLAAFFGMAFLHTGSNLLNDVFDFKKGLDKQVNPVSGAVVRGWITPGEALKGSTLFLAAGTLIGLYLVSRIGAPVFWIGLVGVLIGILYTWGPLPLKFNALGDLAVFLNFGLLGSLGAWTVQTGSLAWTPAIWAVPMSLLVVGILHANNWRDIKPDKSGGIQTVASVLGDGRSEAYYRFLLLFPFAFILLVIMLSWADGLRPRMPLTFLITFIVIPKALTLIKKGKKRFTPDQPQDFIALDGETAQLNLLFGILCTAALGLDALLTAVI
ncbi:MAG: 1,4-dihydroxy-2-naphthoate octaprenyltransferase [Deltaproteobacteria bacterium]|nr:1,4-dihydroxy-2-naphthoate octaprenyltransferase [Deltaproteobacteria bacterium]MBW2175817.1 1,4-dihydroxy-2-naphthoate octaprenyltransferase [Deltaproteobacteria bacterium]MBW2297275.1 1,4-dihydroxy-2-naphthoate octaprenyltransferase [Deltaproteobacteria bacterium]MBW2611985.1 1,4-dihydroxy-2-naphthoate octaprenyltransferase [Deltaproteobacteria bacterium]